MAQQHDYLEGEFRRVSPLKPRRKTQDDEPVIIVPGDGEGLAGRAVTEDTPATAAPAAPAVAIVEAEPVASAPEPAAAPAQTAAAPSEPATAEAAPEAAREAEIAEAPAKALEIEAPAPAEQAPAPAEEAAPAEKAAPRKGASKVSREEALNGLLERLAATSPDVEASAVVSLDGFIMAAALPSGLEEDRVAAMSAAILALGERASGELGRGRLGQVFIEGEKGYVLLMSCGNRAALVAMADKSAKLGLVFYDMRAVAADISAALSSG